MQLLFRVLRVSLMVLIALFGLTYIGLQVRPKPFAPYPGTTPELKTVPVTGDVPAPVHRFYEVALGDRAPLIESVILSGSGSIRLNVCCFRHVTGSRTKPAGHHHYMERPSWPPLVQGNEWYLDGAHAWSCPWA